MAGKVGAVRGEIALALRALDGNPYTCHASLTPNPPPPLPRSLLLVEWAAHNMPRLRHGGPVVELGAGVGFTALAVSHLIDQCGGVAPARASSGVRGADAAPPARYIVTDMSWNILDLIQRNLIAGGAAVAGATAGEAEGSEKQDEAAEGKYGAVCGASAAGHAFLANAMHDWVRDIRGKSDGDRASESAAAAAAGSGCVVEPQPLDWTAVSADLCAAWSPFTVLSADCVYAPDLIDPHLSCIRMMLEAGAAAAKARAAPADGACEPACLMAFQLRSPTTFQLLQEAFPRHRLCCEDLPLGPVEHRFASYYKRDLMRLLRLTLAPARTAPS